VLAPSMKSWTLNHCVSDTLGVGCSLMASPIPTLKGRALRLLSNREHSHRELTEKLKPHACSEQELTSLLQWLSEKGFINEQRVLDSLIYRRAPKWGYARVAQELRQKGLCEEAVLAALGDLRQTEADRAWAVWCKKFSRAPPSPQERSRQMRFLLSRGFDASAVSAVLKRAAIERNIQAQDD
jgi:regulatory protein